MLKYEYAFINSTNSSKCFSVRAEGSTREELTFILINKKNVVALYYFLKHFPDIPDDLKEIVENNIKRIAKVDNIENIKFPTNKNTQIYETVSISCETAHSFLSF